MVAISTKTFRYVIAALFCFSCSAAALTRWSSLHIIPDADFIQAWNCVVEYQGYYFNNETEHAVYQNAGLARFGVSEWVDFEAGYVGGFTFGLKAKVLGETSLFVPSVALGVRNFRNHKEDYYYDHRQDVWKSEYFLALGKSVEPLRLRLHAGIQTMPGVKAEQADCFFGIEKYLGGSAYLTLETFYRDKRLRPSLFASVRFFKEHAELSAGAVDLASMFFDSSNRFAMSFVSPPPKGLVRPGIWASLRIAISAKPSGDYKGFGSLEEQIDIQKRTVKVLKSDVDSLKDLLLEHQTRLDSLGRQFGRFSDSVFAISSQERWKDMLLEKLTLLASLYGQESIDAARIKKTEQDIINYRDVAVPLLKEIVLDNKIERKVHVRSIALLGSIGTAKAADAVLDILAQTQDPEVKIEGIIAVGKKKDQRRAKDILERFASDPDSAVAFAATEVLQKPENRSTGKDSAVTLPAPAVQPLVPEKKIKNDTTDTLSVQKKSLQKLPSPPAAPSAPIAPVAPAKPSKKQPTRSGNAPVKENK
jgi:hypothetical protein